MSARDATVFIVDDDPVMLQFSRGILRAAGYSVETFDRPGAALARLTPGDRGCVLLDLRMPDMDGLAVQRSLLARRVLMPVIFVSGHADVPTAVEAMKRGAVDFLTKPIDPGALQALVTRAVQKDAEQAAARAARDLACSRWEALSPREREVCRMFAQGALIKQIAATLQIPESTAQAQRARALHKLHAITAAEVAQIIAQVEEGGSAPSSTEPRAEAVTTAQPSSAPVPLSFNTAGPNDPTLHYTLPAVSRIPDLRRLIDDRHYFVIHGARQTGKTTTLLHLGRELTAEGAYVALLVSMEVGAAFPEDVGAAELAVLDRWRADARARLPLDLQPPPWPAAAAGARIAAALEAWSIAAPRPLVIFIDEIDALRDNVLTSALRQLRGGYPNRPARFPHALALIGLRDLRGGEVASSHDLRLGTGGPFNIQADPLTLRDFTHNEVRALYGLHTAATGQVFAAEAVERAFRLSQGQPWLVNALARHLTQILVPDHREVIFAAKVDEAAASLIRSVAPPLSPYHRHKAT